jgi:hypothetical protein
MAIASPPPGTWTPPPRVADLTRRRIIAATVAVIVLAGGAQLIGIPKILGWRFASQAHARTLEEAITGNRPTRQTTEGALFNQLLGGIEWGDQQPVTIDTGTLATPTRIDTVMATATKILTAHGYTQRYVGGMPNPGTWNCEFGGGTPNADGVITTAATMTCYVSLGHGREHAQIAVVTAVPKEFANSPNGNSGPDASIAPILVTAVQVTVKD